MLARSLRPLSAPCGWVSPLVPVLLGWMICNSVAFAETGVGHIVSAVPTALGQGANINSLLGADAFYNAGFTGQGTISANVEAGHIWNFHESLTHVSQFAHHGDAFGTGTENLYDRHATWSAHFIGGRNEGGDAASANWRTGIAPGTDLRSGAIATNWNGPAYALSFGISGNSFNGGYAPYFGTADVINSSWGGIDPAGASGLAIAMDGFAALNPGTTSVASAGNSGPSSNTVGFPGSGYNSITVAALDNGGNNSYNTVASFSSRGPQDYWDPVIGTITGARAAVDIAAPGRDLYSAFYGGQTGGNNTSLSGSELITSSTSEYSIVAGTSFASPIVAGAVSLVKSASYNTSELASNAASRDTRVVKSVLQNSADKIPGWNNGQVANANGGVNTTQALDYASGAGALNIGQAFEQYVGAGTRDVAGLDPGNQVLVSTIGWDLGNVLLGQTNLYKISETLQAGSLFTTTLNWFRDRAYTAFSTSAFDFGQADLTLNVINLDSDERISQSASLYNTTEHLSFLLPTTARYGIEVFFGANTFGSSGNVTYGLAWAGVTAVPEPASFALISLFVCVCAFRRQRTVPRVLICEPSN